MSGIKSVAYYNILTRLNIQASVHMYNIGKNVRSAIFVETAKNSSGDLQMGENICGSIHKESIYLTQK